MVQANFGGTLRIGGTTVPPAALGLTDRDEPDNGSCMIVAATELNSLCAATTTTTGRLGRVRHAIPISRLLEHIRHTTHAG